MKLTPHSHRLSLAVLLLTTVCSIRAADTPVTGWDILRFLRPQSMQANPNMQMTVFTEMTDYGRKLPEVSPQEPMYFVPYSEGYRPMGGVPAGEHPPMPAELEEYMFRALKTRGFLAAREDTPSPHLVLVYYWGSHSVSVNPPPEWKRREKLERAMLVGGKKFATRVKESMDAVVPGARDMAPEMQILLRQANLDLYYVVVSAYLYHDLVGTKPHLTLAWRTSMTVDAQGVAQRTAMRPLVINASEYFGRETSMPVAIRRNVQSGTVTLGPMDVIDDEVETTGEEKK